MEQKKMNRYIASFEHLAGSPHERDNAAIGESIKAVQEGNVL